MAFHVRFETKDPDVPPSKTGMHWVRTDTGENCIAFGTSSVSDWRQIDSSAKNVTSGPFTAGDQTVNHGLGTKDLSAVTIYDANDNPLDLSWKPSDQDNLTVEFPPGGLAAGARVVVKV